MKKNHHIHRLIRLCLIISLLLLCSTSQVFAAAKVNLKNTKIKLSATKLTYNQKVQRPEGKRHLSRAKPEREEKLCSEVF